MIENDHLSWGWVKRFWPPWVMFFCRMWTKGSRPGKMKENEGYFITVSLNADIPNSLTELRMQVQAVGLFPLLPHGPRGKYPGNFIDAFSYAECDVGLSGWSYRRSYDPKKWSCKASWSPTLWGGIERFWYGEDPLATWSFLVVKGCSCCM